MERVEDGELIVFYQVGCVERGVRVAVDDVDQGEDIGDHAFHVEIQPFGDEREFDDGGDGGDELALVIFVLCERSVLEPVGRLDEREEEIGVSVGHVFSPVARMPHRAPSGVVA